MTEYTPDIDISTATRQQMFDFMLNHLRNQGGPSVNDSAGGGIGESGCMYRGDNGRMCAIGCMVPDILYDADLEGLPARVCIDKIKVTIDSKTREFLYKSQSNLHDALSKEYFLTNLEKNAIDLADQYQLTYTPPVT
jgi:hypothetical protein